MLYWAYGSNLNPVQFRRRCPSAKRIGPLTLNNGQLVFRHVADVAHKEGGMIPGGVWRISKADERALDTYEGIASGLYVKRRIVLSVNGEEGEPCVYYKMNPRTFRAGIQPPSEDYLKIIEQGYEYFELDFAYLSDALHRSWEEKKVTAPLAERYLRRGRPVLATPYAIERD